MSFALKVKHYSNRRIEDVHRINRRRRGFMRLDILIAVILYEILTIVGVGWVIAQQNKKENAKDEFILAGRGLNVTHVGITLALTMLGSAHIWGTTENAWFVGATAVWFGLACTIMMVVITQGTGVWIRDVGVPTTPGFMGLLFGNKSRMAITCIMAPLVFGLLTLETQCIGITFAAMTGWSIKTGCLVGGIFGILYVLLAGMKEVSWLNLINAAVMYVALIITVIMLFFKLPEGWAGVQEYYITENQQHMLSIFGTPSILFAFALPSIVTCTFFQGISQMGLQPAIAAKNVKTVRKSLFLAGPVNGLFCIIPALIGLAAKSIPQFAEAGSKMAAPLMLVNLLPKWNVTLLLAAFLGALLSTFAMTCLVPATLFVKDLYVNQLNPEASEKMQTRLVRVGIVVLGGLAIAISGLQPTVILAINWIFSWLIPVFVLCIIGLFMKRSSSAAMITMVVCWLINCLWSMTSFPQAIGMANVHNAFVALFISIILGVLLSLILPGKKSFFYEHREKKLQAQIA